LVAAIQAASVDGKQCGKLDETQVKNGQLFTQPNEHPWIGRIEADRRVYGCAVVLIDAQHALLPAHCIERADSEPKAVIFGSTDPENNSTEATAGGAAQRLLVIEINIHPDYSRRDHINDLAVIKLKDKVVLTDFVQPICLPSAEVQKGDIAAGELIVAGFEGPNHGVRETKRIKMPFEAISSKECNRQQERFSTTLICGSSRVGPLSGSALVEATGSPPKYHLIGIVTVGFKNQKKEVHGHENIPSKLDWILRNTAD
ncbi:hypothetical protein KR018_009713, partial [Drosophila ironensis]